MVILQNVYEEMKSYFMIRLNVFFLVTYVRVMYERSFNCSISNQNSFGKPYFDFNIIMLTRNPIHFFATINDPLEKSVNIMI